MSWEKPKKILGVYMIKLCIDGKETVYVGVSKNIKRRWKRHRWQLNQNHHRNSLLQQAWNDYDKKYFKFVVLRKCKDMNKAYELEKYYAEFYGYGNFDKCFNIGEPGNIHAPINTLIGGVCYA